MRRVLAAAVSVVGLLTAIGGVPASADSGSGGGNPRWTASYQYGAPALFDAIEVSSDNGTVFVSGIAWSGGMGRFTTLAYDAAGGAVRWTDEFPGDQRDEFGHGWALTLSPDGSTVFVTGFNQCVSGCDTSSFEGFTTIAYDASSGDRRWVSRLATTGGAPTAIAATPDGSTVLVSATNGLSKGYVVAYDAESGDMVWKVAREKAEGHYGGGLSLSQDGAVTYVADTDVQSDSCFDSGGYRVTAFDTSDGTILWTSTFKPGAGACGSATDLGLSPDGSTLYVTGYAEPPIGDSRRLYAGSVVAINAQSGAQRWTRVDDDISVLSGDTTVSLGVAPDGSGIFLASDGCNDYPACVVATSAYTASGDHRWSSSYDGGGRAYVHDLAVNPGSDTVYVTAEESMPCYAGCPGSEVEAPVVAYDAASGEERWVTTYSNSIGKALEVSPDGSSVYLAGSYIFTEPTSARSVARGTSPGCVGQCGDSTTRLNTRTGPGTYDDASGALRYDGWRSTFANTALGGAYRESDRPGDSAVFRTPKVESISWVTRDGPDQGKAKLFVDGRLKRTLDLYSPTDSARTVTVDGLTRRAHRVKVKVLGRHGSSSAGSWVAVDAFRYRAEGGIAEETSPAVHFNSWSGRVSAAADGGALRRSDSPASKVTLDFRGGTISWITAAGPRSGRARVVIDGEAHRVDLYRETRQPRAVIRYTDLGKGRHHLVIKPLGTKNPKSDSASVAVDSFVVRR